MAALTKIRKGGVWRDITGCKIFAQGTWREILQIKIYKGGAWRTVANFSAPAGGGGGGGGTIAVSISPSSFSVHAEDTLQADSSTLTATPSGGVAPYSYTWEPITFGGLCNGVSFTHAGLASTIVTMFFSGYGSGSVSLRCTATDSLGSTGSATILGSGNAVSTL